MRVNIHKTSKLEMYQLKHWANLILFNVKFQSYLTPCLQASLFLVSCNSLLFSFRILAHRAPFTPKPAISANLQNIPSILLPEALEYKLKLQTANIFRLSPCPPLKFTLSLITTQYADSEDTNFVIKGKVSSFKHNSYLLRLLQTDNFPMYLWSYGYQQILLYLAI